MIIQSRAEQGRSAAPKVCLRTAVYLLSVCKGEQGYQFYQWHELVPQKLGHSMKRATSSTRFLHSLINLDH